MVVSRRLGVLASPAQGRKICFVFFVLALLFSGGGVDLLTFSSPELLNGTFLLAAYVGVVAGALGGLGFMLRVQAVRSKKPNKALEPTTTAVTPPAAQESRQP